MIRKSLLILSGWAGFGIPAEAGEMIGGSAIIVKSCPTCPSGQSCHMCCAVWKSLATATTCPCSAQALALTCTMAKYMYVVLLQHSVICIWAIFSMLWTRCLTKHSRPVNCQFNLLLLASLLSTDRVHMCFWAAHNTCCCIPKSGPADLEYPPSCLHYGNISNRNMTCCCCSIIRDCGVIETCNTTAVSGALLLISSHYRLQCLDNIIVLLVMEHICALSLPHLRSAMDQVSAVVPAETFKAPGGVSVVSSSFHACASRVCRRQRGQLLPG